jgi:hypothetical protein
LESPGSLPRNVPLGNADYIESYHFRAELEKVLKENPGAALGLLFREFGEWLKNASGGE